MWVLVQTNIDKTKIKYLCSYEYDNIIKYIHSYPNVRKLGDYKWFAMDGMIEFNIMLGDVIE